MGDDGAKARQDGEVLCMNVLVPDGVPPLYPQAARVLCRIVVGLAQVERGAETGSQAEGQELERRRTR
jgi:hypothetical protein